MDLMIELQSFPPRIFRERNRLSRAKYFELEKQGRGPRRMACGNISADAERDWQRQEEARAQTAEALLERQRRSEYFSRLGKIAAASPKHICRISPEERAARRKKKLRAKAKA